MKRNLGSLFVLAILVASTCVQAQPPADPPKAPSSAAPPPSQPDKKPATKDFNVEGVYVEACTCKNSCMAEITGEPTGCDAVAAVQITKGAYDGKDISGTRIAVAVDHGDQVHLYLDAPDAARKAALESFARAAFAGFGVMNSVAAAKIELAGKDGAYTVKVDSGKIMTLSTVPVLGGDHKKPVAIENSQHPLNPTLFQGHCEACAFTDGDHKVTIEKGRNSYFNHHMKASGKL